VVLSVTISSPNDGDVINGPVAVFVASATASSTHPIDNVEFFFGSISIGQASPTIATYNTIVAGDIFPTNGLAVVAGVGTAFLTDFAINDFVMFNSQPTAIYKILSIASNISLTLTTSYTGATPTPSITGTASLTNGISAVLGGGTVTVGTVSVTNGLAAVTGAGTTFTTDLTIGARIIITSQPTVVYQVLSITDDLNLTLTTVFTGATIAGTTLQNSITSFLTDLLIGSYVIIASQPGVIYRVLSITDEINLTLITVFTGATVAGTTIQKAFTTKMRSIILSSNFSVVTVDVQPGTYVLSAVVSDILGATATSPLVNITVVGFLTTLPPTSSFGSSIGFGHNPFGANQFGFGDWAEEMLWKTLPEFYREVDETGPSGSVVSQPLRKFQNALKPSYQELRVKWHQFPFLWDALVVPLDQLPQLGYNVGITVDPTKPEDLQRSSVLNASQLWVNKGSDKGYEITGAFEGLVATITPLWAETCAPASLTLGTIGILAASFDLSTTALSPRPVSPGSLRIKVTTKFGTVEEITDSPAATTTLSINTIVGLFSVGDTVTQGTTTGIIVGTTASTVILTVTTGGFKLGAILDTTSLATATTIAVNVNSTLVGAGNKLNGPLTRLNITTAVTMTINTIVGVFSLGATVTQGATTGTIVESTATTITVIVTAGVFALGTVIITVPPATANVIAISANIITDNEVFKGITSGTTAVMREFSPTHIIMDRISTLGGFVSGETIRGLVSNTYARAGISTTLVPGPLQAQLNLSGVTGTFVVGDQVTGTTSTAIGIIRSVVGLTTIYVDTITLPGFLAGEGIATATPATATINTVSFGTIDYISGQMEGITTSLLAGSEINAVVDLATSGPTKFIPKFDEISADLLPLDDVQSDRYAKWPHTYHPIRINRGVLTGGECRSHSLRLYFTKKDNTEIENFIDVAGRIKIALEQFRPIHVSFDKISFDGARASSQLWRTNQILADSAAATVWTAPIAGNQLASSQIWTTGPFSATVTI
jgi:hypothetical protein